MKLAGGARIKLFEIRPTLNHTHHARLSRMMREGDMIVTKCCAPLAPSSIHPPAQYQVNFWNLAGENHVIVGSHVC